MGTPTYNAQVFTFSIAKEHCNVTVNATPYRAAHKPPFCLRVVREHRTPEMQQFRNTIAKLTKEARHGY